MMPSLYRRRAFSVCASLICVAFELSAGHAAAEEASATETAAARSLAVEGLKLAQAGNCADAAVKLERAQKLYHSAIVASRLGECYVDLGRLVEGTEVLRKVVREPLPADAQPALLKAVERAQRALDAAKPRIAGITIKVVLVNDLSLKVDGRLVPAALIDTEIPTDPGEHTIEASAPGFLKSSSRISLGVADKKTVTLGLTRDPNAAPASPTTPPPAATGSTHESEAGESAPAEAGTSSSPSAPRPSPNRSAAYVSLGLGAIGLGVGGVLGVMTMKERNELKSSCPADVCAPRSQESLESAKRLGNLSTIAVGVGAAGIVLGSVLFFTAGASSEERAELVPQKRARFVGLTNPRASLGFGHVRVGADF